MAAAAGAGGDSTSKQIKYKIKIGDDKEHADDCPCPKCTYFMVTPVSKSVQDGKDTKAQMEPAQGRSLKNIMAQGRPGKKAAKGLKALRLSWPQSVAFTTTAGGVVSTAVRVLADANAAEWTAMTALYDEYRVLGGKFMFQPAYQTPAGAFTPDTVLAVMAYDPVDGTALSSVRNGSELSQHVLCASQPASQATNSTALSSSFGHASGKLYAFKFTTQGMNAFTATTTTTVEPIGQWKIMNAAGSNSSDGWLKYYGTSDIAAAGVSAVVGILYLDVEFRSRK